MKKTINFKVIIVKVLIIIGVFSIPVTSYYSFDQTIPNTILCTLLAISILGNFYSPLHFNCSNNLDLTVNLNHAKFQPIYITKQNGITESINIRFCRNSTTEKIESIDFEVVSYSGLLRHGISSVTPVCEDGTGHLIFGLSFLSSKKKNISIDCLPEKLQNQLNFPKDKTFDIYTSANYGMLHQLRIKFTKYLCKENSDECPKIIDEGSICNINCVHTLS